MNSWQKELIVDPVPALLSLGNEAIKYFTMRDLLDKKVESIKILWNLPEAKKILRKQHYDGSWKYPATEKQIKSKVNYDQYETYKTLGELVEKFGFTKEHQSIQNAADFLFQFQTEEGDFRGIYAHQYSTTYSSAIMELLIKAGYVNDPRILRGFDWLFSIRQDDGGWALPFRTMGEKIGDAFKSSDLIQPDKSKSFSHLVTGMVLRAFAAHPKYRKSDVAKKGCELLISRFFKSDIYPDRQNKNFWERVSFPFLYTDIVSALDSLYFLGFNLNYPEIEGAFKFLRDKQDENGCFNLKITRGRDKHLPYWICLAVCKLFKRYLSKT